MSQDIVNDDHAISARRSNSRTTSVPNRFPASLASAAGSSAADSRTTPAFGEEHPGAPGGGIAPSARREAERLIGDIGVEFNRLRKVGRAAAWADLEDRVASGGSLLISTGMITAKDWVGMMIDIEQFRKNESGTGELAGDALAKWLSDTPNKPKGSKSKDARSSDARSSDTPEPTPPPPPPPPPRVTAPVVFRPISAEKSKNEYTVSSTSVPLLSVAADAAAAAAAEGKD